MKTARKYSGLPLIAAVALIVAGCTLETPTDLSPPAKARPRMDAHVRNAAMDHEEAGNRTAAIQAYTEAIEQKPHAVDAYWARGQAHQAAGNYEQAEADFNTVLRHEPRRAAAYFSRGQALQSQGKHHQAIVSYSLAISVEPRQAKWYYLRGKAYQALADEAVANGEPGRASELRQRAGSNLATAKQLDPITDFETLSGAAFK